MKNVIIVPTYSVGYYRNARTGLIEVNALISGKRQRLTIAPSLFLTVFPQIERRWTGGTIEATPDQLAALGFDISAGKSSVKLADMPHRVRYVYNPFLGRYICRLLGTAQELSASAAAFRRIAGISERAVLGSITLSDEQIKSIGFVLAVKGVSASDYVEHAAIYA